MLWFGQHSALRFRAECVGLRVSSTETTSTSSALRNTIPHGGNEVRVHVSRQAFIGGHSSYYFALLHVLWILCEVRPMHLAPFCSWRGNVFATKFAQSSEAVNRSLHIRWLNVLCLMHIQSLPFNFCQ